MKEAGKKVLIAIMAIAVAGLGIHSYYLSRKMDDLSGQLQEVQAGLYNSVKDSQNTITEQMREMINQSQSLLDSYTFAYSGVDTESRMVSVKFSFSLKASTAGSSVIVKPRIQGGQGEAGEGIKASTGDGVQYLCEMQLSYENDYDFDLYEISKEGTAKKLNTEEVALYPKSDFSNRTRVSTISSSVSEDGFELEWELENCTFGTDAFQIEKQELILSSDGSDILRKEITSVDETGKNVPPEEETSGAEKKNSPAPAQEGGPLCPGEWDEQVISYSVVIPADQLENWKPKKQKVSFRLEITYQNGETAVIDM